jgi:penicillin-binding protein 1C
VPTLLTAATIAGEDRDFRAHAGVDGAALARAAWLDLTHARLTWGGSTITMQLARLVDGHPPHTIAGKVGDLLDALRLERALSKDQLLEQYLNRAYYGNGAFGVEAAARTYFGRPATQLSDGEALLLAALPRAPTAYDPVRHFDAALARSAHLAQLLAAGGLSLPAIDRPVLAGAHSIAFRAPHFVDHVLEGLPPELRAHGGVVRTTLDGRLQERVEALVREHVAARTGERVQEAGVVVLDARSGAVRALVGSPDYARSQLDIVTTPRHPGSTLKPFTYALALEQGDTPSTLALDIDEPLLSRSVASKWHSHNADLRQHGPVRYRTALACSYNLAAVHVAERVGVGRLLERLRAAGLDTLAAPADEYGPALTLGAGPVRLLDLANAYRAFVDGGELTPAFAVEALEPVGAPRAIPPRGPRRRLFSPSVSWLVMDMLADPEARRPAFGDDLPFDLPFPVAAKTGTSGGFADNVAVIATREYVVAAWAGNFDGKPMHSVLAMWGAAPLARAALLAAADGRALTLPERPPSIVERPVCALSGAVPGPACPVKRERFLADNVPRAPCPFHKMDAGRVAVAWPPEAARWARRNRASR